MNETIEFLKQLTDPQSIIQFGGLALLLFVVFAETGLFFGFFLPGDSLIFISGMIAVSKPELLGVHIIVLELYLIVAAALGNIAGYWFGQKVGTSLFNRKDSLLFKKTHIEMTRHFYAKHGGKTLIIGRFLPIIRTFAPILAGIIKIDLKKFMLFNIIGAAIWVGILASTGFYLGSYPWVQKNIEYIVIALIIITLLPLITVYFKTDKNKN